MGNSGLRGVGFRGVAISGAGPDLGGSRSRERISGGRDFGVAISGGRFSGDHVTGLDLGS